MTWIARVSHADVLHWKAPLRSIPRSLNCNEEAAMLRSIRTSIATVSISGTLPEKLQAIKAAGFDGVEIFENDLVYFDGTPADVRRMCADLGLEIYLFQPFRD